jgi:hypothetical protein
MTIPIYQLTDQWGDPTKTFIAIAMNVFDTGHAAGSKLLDLQVNGNSQFSVSDTGGILLLSDLHFFRDELGPAPGGALALRSDVGWAISANAFSIGTIALGTGQVRPLQLFGANVLIGGASTDVDLGIFRAAPGVLEINAGSPGVKQGCYLRWGGTARVAADVSYTNATLANITGLAVNVNAGRAYSFEVELSFTCLAAAGIQCAIGGTAIATNIIYDGWIVDSAANGIKGNAQAAALGGVVASAVTVGTAGHVTIRGTIEVNTAGTLTVQAAQNTANATATVVKRGSRLIVHDVT